jgi:putative acyl-CoA dehydrogenase
MLRHAKTANADAFCTSRLNGDGAASFGTLPATAALAAIMESAYQA